MQKLRVPLFFEAYTVSEANYIRVDRKSPQRAPGYILCFQSSFFFGLALYRADCFGQLPALSSVVGYCAAWTELSCSDHMLMSCVSLLINFSWYAGYLSGMMFISRHLVFQVSSDIFIAFCRSIGLQQCQICPVQASLMAGLVFDLWHCVEA